MQVTTHALNEFNDEAARFVRELHPKAAATIVALSGNLGAGKTTFVQALAREYGVEEQVNSPTFVIEKIYDLEDKPYRRLVHIDAYRLEGERDLRVLGWPELIADPGNLILVEWPENVSSAIPEGSLHVSLQGDGEERHITYGEK